MRDLTPPTPPIALAVLLDRADLGLRQVAGPPAGDVEVLWVHASEMADPLPYLLGGELLLTAGAHIGPAVEAGAHLDHYVARTVEAGAAALGFGLAPVHDSTPPALIEACDRHCLPLLEVPPRTPFTAVARAVWEAMAEARHGELRRVAEAQRSLASAAARPDPVPAVLRQLARHLGGAAVLLGPDGGELAAAGTRPDSDVLDAMARLARRVRPSAGGRRAPASATDTVGEAHIVAYAPPTGARGETPVLVVASDRRDAMGHAVAGVGAVLLSLLTGPYRGGADTGRSAAVVRLLLGADPEEVAATLGGGSGWTVVHARRRAGAAPGGPLAVAALAAALGTPLVDVDGDTVRALVPAGGEVAAQPGWTLGVSAPAAAGGLPEADAQAAGALRRAVAARSALARHRTGAPQEGMAALVDPREARARARALLAPLADSEALVATLRTWLSLHGSWDRTAVALGVHRNTVRQRVARAARLLAADLDDADVRMDLWFALRWRD